MSHTLALAGSTALRESLGVAALLGLPLALPFLTYGLLHDPGEPADRDVNA